MNTPWWSRTVAIVVLPPVGVIADWVQNDSVRRLSLIPTIVFAFWSLAQFPFGGTSILIAVGVALETMKQIESQLLMRHYEGFLG